MESNLENLEVKCFKRILSYTGSILKMPDQRYPRICYNRFKKLPHDPDPNKSNKYNWFTQVKEIFFDKINKAETWINLSKEDLINQKQHLISLLKNYLVERNREKCISSTSLTFYPMISQMESTTNYLDLMISLYHKRVLAQLRLFNNYVARICLKIKKSVEDGYCEYCSTRNDIFHMITSCYFYNEPREKLLPELAEDENKVFNFTQVLNGLSEVRARKLVNLIHIILYDYTKKNGVI